jgi:hypothetical protein
MAKIQFRSPIVFSSSKKYNYKDVLQLGTTLAQKTTHKVIEVMTDPKTEPTLIGIGIGLTLAIIFRNGDDA